MHISANTVENAAAFSFQDGINSKLITILRRALTLMLLKTYFSLFAGIKTQSDKIHANIEKIYAKHKICNELIERRYLGPEIINTTYRASINKPVNAGRAKRTNTLLNLISIFLYSSILCLPKSIAKRGTVTINIAEINVFTI